MKGTILIGIGYVCMYAVMIAAIWGVAYFVSQKTEKVTIITPQENVKCVVVSRTFNTSVDCWKE